MICISAGHHPTKPGACFKGFCEHAEALRWASDIVLELGYRKAVLVPPGPLRDKVQFINDHDPVIALEVHFNSAVNARGDHIGEGCETLYYPGSTGGMLVAEEVQNELAVLFPPSRGVKEGWYRMDPSNGPDYFLARTRCPAVIVEPEFIHHVDRISKLQHPAAVSIAKALLVAERKLI